MSPIRVLYSFPHRLGAQRICHTAWQQVEQVSRAGAKVTVLCASVARPVNRGCQVKTTLSLGRARVPARLVGRERCLDLHDLMTARWLRRNYREIDIVHAWPGAAMRTIKEAQKHGIPCVLERPNTHTGYAFEAAAAEAERCGIQLPKGHDHAFNRERLEQELCEYSACDFLLCPSDFVRETFIQRGIPDAKILRHRYGFDRERFFGLPEMPCAAGSTGVTALYAGVCEPRKGLHYLLEAWFMSGAHQDSRLRICGEFVPGYRESLKSLLDHSSIEVLGHRSDVPELMRASDLFVLSSVEEGSALVTYEAMASGCVLLVSDATGAPCAHGETGLIHGCRNVKELADHLTLVRQDEAKRRTLRTRRVESSRGLSWEAAGQVLAGAYQGVLKYCGNSTPVGVAKNHKLSSAGGW